MRGHRGTVLGNFASPKDVCFVDCENLVDDVQNRLESRSDGLTPANCRVTTEDLPQDLCVRDQPLSGGGETLQQYLRFGFARMRRPHEVHRDVRIDKDQA
jgi:hypothetical protein